MCIDGYEWTNQGGCQRECNLTYAIGTIFYSRYDSICECRPGFVWNGSEENCVIICDPKTTLGREDGVEDECKCPGDLVSFFPFEIQFNETYDGNYSNATNQSEWGN